MLAVEDGNRVPVEQGKIVPGIRVKPLDQVTEIEVVLPLKM